MIGNKINFMARMTMGLLAVMMCFNIETYAYEKRDFLQREYQQTGNVFLMQGKGLPYPAYYDREGWNRIPETVRRKVIANAENFLGYEWKVVPLTSYLAFERTGNRTSMQDPYESNRLALNSLILGELAEGKGRFIDQIANGVWYSCQMTSWVLSAHLIRQETKRALPDSRYQIIDLGSAAYAATIAFAWHFFHDEFEKMDPSINYTIEQAMEERVFKPYLDNSINKANWWKAADWKPGQIVNNWNPWCTSNVMLCAIMMEQNPDRFREMVETSIASVDHFINYVKSDGACEEGPAYWQHAAGKLYDYLQIMHYASEGRFSIMDEPMMKRLGEYAVTSYIGGDDYVVNFADATAKQRHDPDFVYRFGKAVDSRPMMNFALYSCADRSGRQFKYPSPKSGSDTFRSLESLFCLAGMNKDIDELNQSALDFETRCTSLLARESVWYPETEVAFFRNETGWFAAMKGGFNNESHNHNDTGSCILFADDIPVLVDAGVVTYTRQTFSSERYTIWTMQGNWHNIPSINGKAEMQGSRYKAKDVKCDLARKTFSADISGTYKDEAACRSWVRGYRLKDDSFEITDKFELSERKAADTLNFMVQGEVHLPGEIFEGKAIPKDKVLIVNGGEKFYMSFPAGLTPSVTVKELVDQRLTKIWGPVLRRISFTTSAQAPVKGSWKFVIRQKK